MLIVSLLVFIRSNFFFLHFLNHLTNLISLSFQVTYIVRGSGRAQVVGADGRRVLETTVKAGNLFIVPRFFVVSKIADSDGLEWFSIITTPK